MGCILSIGKKIAFITLWSHTYALMNSKQGTKLFNSTLDMHGQDVFLWGFLRLSLIWRTEDSGFDFSSIWGYLLHSIPLFQQQLQFGLNPLLHDLS